MSEGHWAHVSEEAKEFVYFLLRRYPHQRWTAQQCLESRWLKMKCKVYIQPSLYPLSGAEELTHPLLCRSTLLQ